jgi:hypothetical protein
MMRSASFIAALGLVGAMAAAQAQPAANRFGVPAEVSEATRTITVKPGAKYVNVRQGDIVKFVANGREFAFRFDNYAEGSFDLRSIAPAGTLDHPVTCYLGINQDLKGGK